VIGPLGRQRTRAKGAVFDSPFPKSALRGVQDINPRPCFETRELSSLSPITRANTKLVGFRSVSGGERKQKVALLDSTNRDWLVNEQGRTTIMKKVLCILLAIGAVSLALVPAVALAGTPTNPNYGVVDPVGITNLPPEWMSDVDKIIPAPQTPFAQIHIVDDPLNSVVTDEAMGWVTFWCQSTVGFQYNIGVNALAPLSTYHVRAVGGVFEIVPPGTTGAIDTGEGFWILAVGTADWDLGSFKTDTKGLGGVRGVLPLAPGVYVVATAVTDDEGGSVLYTPLDDANEFVVY
jgi:hypothetical protein